MKKALLILFTCILITESQNLKAQVLESDSLALVALYNATGGPNWTNNTNWLQPGKEIKDWWGIGIADLFNSEVEVKRINSIELVNNGLRGLIPVELFNLTELEFIRLDENELSGSIPSNFSSLTKLTWLSLSFNQFSGTIPVELGSLVNLSRLDLGNNFLEGSIPKDLGNLTNLEILNLGWNQLTGSIPDELGNLNDLEGLILSDNSLSGSIPSSIGSLSALLNLNLTNNLLMGQIPSELGDLSNLKSLSLWRNQISGTIPNTIGNLSRLEFLDLSSNEIDGSIPSTIGQLLELKNLNLSFNNLDGLIPNSIISLEKLEGLAFNNNPGLCEPTTNEYINWIESLQFEILNFDICLPVFTENTVIEADSLALVVLYNVTNGSSWTNSTNWLQPGQNVATWHGVTVEGGRVTSLVLGDTDASFPYDGNNLVGSIPPAIGDLDALTYLSLSGNQLTGTIPAEMGNMTSLEQLFLYGNALSGSIPSELGDLSNLFWLYLFDNQLSGSIPSSLSNLSELQVLALSSNQLSAAIPSELGSLAQLQFMWLFDNSLEGEMPSSLDQLSNLVQFDVSANQLSGQVPVTYANLSTLEGFNISNNLQLCEPESANYTTWVSGLTTFNNSNTCIVCENAIEVTAGNYTAPFAPYWYTYTSSNLENLIISSRGTMVDTNLEIYDACDGNLIAFNDDINTDAIIYQSEVQLVLQPNQTIYIHWTPQWSTNGFDWLLEVSPHIPVNVTDSLALVALYNATNGQNWNVNTNWLQQDQFVASWQGVTTENGRVISITMQDDGTSTFNGNGLVGNLPTQIGDLTALVELNLSSNDINGDIPVSIGGMAALEVLNLSFNQLTGNIPVEIGSLSALMQLWLRSNQITGDLPQELSNLASLNIINLADNDISGTVPDGLVNLTNVNQLQLQNNMNLCEPTSQAYIDWTAGITNYQNDNTCQNLGGGVLESDSLALVALYNSTNGPNWINNTNWLQQGQKVEDWFGVTVSDGRVTELNFLEGDPNQFAGNNLVGTLPSSLGDLTALEVLALDFNQLSGTIPMSLGNLQSLVSLLLSGNQLTGAIPAELGNLPNLEALWLEDNLLTGSIPQELGNLSSLTSLLIHTNNLSGSIPADFGNLTNLETLWLYDNQLSGSIPSELGNMTKLDHLLLQNNNLTGTIPSTIGQLTNMNILSLRSNQLTGNIPANLGNLTNATQISLRDNNLSGELPEALSNLTNIELLHLHDNNFSGVVPVSFTGLTSLNDFQIQNNLNLCEPTSQSYIDWTLGIDNYQNSNTCQQLANGVLASDSLALVALYNSTNGDNWINNTNWLEDGQYVEDWFGVTVENGRITQLDLSDDGTQSLLGNNLSGSLPIALGQLSDLKRLNLSSNNLSGSIPKELAQLSVLVSLSFSNNNLTANLPTELGQLTSLEALYLNMNDFEGNLPSEWSNLEALRIFYIGQNQLSGIVPEIFTELSNLQVLSIADNVNLCEPITQAYQDWANNLGLYQNDNTCVPISNGVLESDSLALVALYNSTNGPNWTNNTNWLQPGQNVETWFGVTVENERVTSLILKNDGVNEFTGNALNGSLPPEIGNLSALTILEIGYNQLTGPIPDEIGNLTNLVNLFLRENGLSGTLPSSVGNLTRLQVFNVIGNQLSGEIPAGLFSIQSLEYLWMSSNQFTGVIPTSITGLTNPIVLDLANNAMTGPIPAELGDLASLPLIWLNDNDFNGIVPGNITDVDVSQFRIANNPQLCEPTTQAYLDWVGGLDEYDNTNTCQLETAFISYDVPGQLAPTIIDADNSTISVELPCLQDYLLTPSFELSDGATATVNGITQVSGQSEIDLSFPVSYEVTNGGASTTWTVVPQLPAQIESFDVDITDNTSCLIDNGALSLNSITVGGNEVTSFNDYTINWSDNNFATVLSDELSVSGLEEGEYQLRVTNNITGCVAQETVIIETTPVPISVDAQVSAQTNCDIPNGEISINSITIDGSDIALPDTRFDLNWSDAGAELVRTGLAAGSYDLTITDTQSGCTYDESFSVASQTLSGTIQASTTNVSSCTSANGGASANVDGATAGFDFEWYAGGSATGTPISTAAAISGRAAGSYTVKVNETGSDCFSTLTIGIGDVRPTLSINLESTDNQNCTNPNGVVSIASIERNGEELTNFFAYDIVWSTESDVSEELSDDDEVTGLAADRYYVQVTDLASGCSGAIASIEVEDAPTSPALTLTTSANTTCAATGNGQATIISETTGLTVAWYQGDQETLIPNQTNATITGLTAGGYSAVVINTATGCTNSSTFTISNDLPEITLSASSTANTNCLDENGSVTLMEVTVDDQSTSTFDAFSIEWSASEDFGTVLSSAASSSALAAGTYFVRVTLDSVSCQSDAAEVTVMDQLSAVEITLVNSAVDKPGTEATGSLEISAVAGATIQWYAGDEAAGTVIGTTATLSNIDAGNYTVEVTDPSTGCTGSATYEVGTDDRQAQTITFELPVSLFQDELPLTLAATSDQSLPITYSISSGVGVINGDQLVSAEPGNLTIVAANAGTSSIEAAEATATIAIKGNYSLSGSVQLATGGSPIDGEVIIYNTTEEEVSRTPFSNGVYQVPNLREGSYIIKIERALEFADLILNTYYEDALTIASATEVIMDSYKVIDITVQSFNVAQSGSGTIIGTVTLVNGRSRIVIGRTLDGTPIEGIQVYLVDRNSGEVVGQAITDNSGSFTFDNVATGQYRLVIDAVGFELSDLEADIDFDESQGTLELGAQLGTDGLTVEIAVVSSVEEELLREINIYPNPVNAFLNVEDPQHRIHSMQLHDLSGRLTRELDIAQVQHDLSRLSNGVYLLRMVLLDNQVVHKKIIIQH